MRGSDRTSENSEESITQFVFKVMAISTKDYRPIYFLVEEVIANADHPFRALHGCFEEDVCNAAFFIQAAWEKKQARDNVHTGCDVEGFNHIEENEKTQREVDDGHEEQNNTCPVVVGTDVGGNCVGENALNFFSNDGIN